MMKLCNPKEMQDKLPVGIDTGREKERTIELYSAHAAVIGGGTVWYNQERDNSCITSNANTQVFYQFICNNPIFLVARQKKRKPIYLNPVK